MLGSHEIPVTRDSTDGPPQAGVLKQNYSPYGGQGSTAEGSRQGTGGLAVDTNEGQRPHPGARGIRTAPGNSSFWGDDATGHEGSGSILTGLVLVALHAGSDRRFFFLRPGFMGGVGVLSPNEAFGHIGHWIDVFLIGHPVATMVFRWPVWPRAPRTLCHDGPSGPDPLLAKTPPFH
jgi:hypothetical protein